MIDFGEPRVIKKIIAYPNYIGPIKEVDHWVHLDNSDPFKIPVTKSNLKLPYLVEFDVERRIQKVGIETRNSGGSWLRWEEIAICSLK